MVSSLLLMLATTALIPAIFTMSLPTRRRFFVYSPQNTAFPVPSTWSSSCSLSRMTLVPSILGPWSALLIWAPNVTNCFRLAQSLFVRPTKFIFWGYGVSETVIAVCCGQLLRLVHGVQRGTDSSRSLRFVGVQGPLLLTLTHLALLPSSLLPCSYPAPGFMGSFKPLLGAFNLALQKRNPAVSEGPNGPTNPDRTNYCAETTAEKSGSLTIPRWIQFTTINPWFLPFRLLRILFSWRLD